jgi:hypothetical protein
MSRENSERPMSSFSYLVEHDVESEFDYLEINREIAKVIDSQAEISRRECNLPTFITLFYNL